MAWALVFDRITKRFGDKLALDALSLAVEPGEILGFLGANGAGKSTAIQLALGFLHPDSGNGQVLGVPFSKARAVRNRVGYVPDAPVFFAGTPLDAVQLAARLNGAGTGREVEARAHRLLDSLDLPWRRVAGRPRPGDARKLSRGQQQRLAIAQALVNQPDLLILDEPTSALDPPGVTLVREQLAAARDRGAAIFFSSHQLQEVEALCDRAAFIEGGKLVHVGSMAQLLAEGAMARIKLRNLPAGSSFARAYSASLQDDALALQRGDMVFLVAIEEQRWFLEEAWRAGAEVIEVHREHRTLADLFARRKRAYGPQVATGKEKMD